MNQRERELVSGHGELRYAAFIAVTAPTNDALAVAIDEITDAAIELSAARCGSSGGSRGRGSRRRRCRWAGGSDGPATRHLSELFRQWKLGAIDGSECVMNSSWPAASARRTGCPAESSGRGKGGPGGLPGAAPCRRARPRGRAKPPAIPCAGPPGNLGYPRRRVPVPRRSRPGRGGCVDRQRGVSRRSFVFDPWVLYGRGVFTNPNIAVAGEIGTGKSSLLKSLVTRSLCFRRRAYVPGSRRGSGPESPARSAVRPSSSDPACRPGSTRSIPAAGRPDSTTPRGAPTCGHAASSWSPRSARRSSAAPCIRSSTPRSLRPWTRSPPAPASRSCRTSYRPYSTPIRTAYYPLAWTPSTSCEPTARGRACAVPPRLR